MGGPTGIGEQTLHEHSQKGGVSLASCMTSVFFWLATQRRRRRAHSSALGAQIMVGEAAPRCAFPPALIEMNERPGKCFN